MKIIQHIIPWKALLTFAPFLACLLLFKAVVNVPNDVTASANILQRVIDLNRYAVMLPLLAIGALQFGGGALVVFGALLWLKRVRMVANVPAIAAALILAGYVGIYAITPHDLAWHIKTSLDRLLLHVFPVVIYELSRTPE